MKIAPHGTFSPSRYKDPNRLKEEVDSRIAAGVGGGFMDTYEPWLKIGSFASKGASYVPPSLKYTRSHHFLSKGEYHFYLLQEYAADVIEIREQFPLIDYGRTFQIAVEKGYRPSYYRGTNVPRVYTTDFMLTKVNAAGETYLSAVSIKSRVELAKIAKSKNGLRRTIQLAQIEKAYWIERGVQWDTVFIEDLPMNRVKNIQAVMTYACIKASLCSDKAINGMIKFLLEIGLTATSEVSLKTLVREASKYLYMSYTDAFELFMYMIWKKYITADLDNYLIRVTRPLNIVSVSGVMVSSEISGVA